MTLPLAALTAAAVVSAMWMFTAAASVPRVRRERTAAAGPTGSPAETGAGGGVDARREFSDATPSRSGPKKKSLITPTRAAAAVAAGVAVGWLTKWPVMGFFYFSAVMAMPWLTTKNSQRQRNISAVETVEKLADSIVALVAGGRKVEQAAEIALSSPTVEFQDSAAVIRTKMASSFTAGLEELRVRVDHSLGDILASTLYFVSVSEAAGRPAEALRSISEAASDTAAMERRIMVRQREGYTSAKITMWATLLIMMFQALTVRASYEIYDTATGQMLMAVIGMIMAVGVWLTLFISRGRGTLRIDFPLEQ